MKETKIKWWHKVGFYMLAFIIFMICGSQMERYRANTYKKTKLRRKLKFFNPVITETIWGRKVTWVGREKPLTDEELEHLF